jgi:uncharacterized protein (DUF58 family)
MTTPLKIAYWVVLLIFAVMAIILAVTEFWLGAALAVLFGAMFAYAAPFVLGRRWRPPPPPATRRPIIRRRR